MLWAQPCQRSFAAYSLCIADTTLSCLLSTVMLCRVTPSCLPVKPQPPFNLTAVFSEGYNISWKTIYQNSPYYFLNEELQYELRYKRRTDMWEVRCQFTSRQDVPARGQPAQPGQEWRKGCAESGSRNCSSSAGSVGKAAGSLSSDAVLRGRTPQALLPLLSSHGRAGAAREQSRVFCRAPPCAVARLRWEQSLQLRALSVESFTDPED